MVRITNMTMVIFWYIITNMTKDEVKKSPFEAPSSIAQPSLPAKKYETSRNSIKSSVSTSTNTGFQDHDHKMTSLTTIWYFWPQCYISGNLLLPLCRALLHSDPTGLLHPQHHLVHHLQHQHLVHNHFLTHIIRFICLPSERVNPTSIVIIIITINIITISKIITNNTRFICFPRERVKSSSSFLLPPPKLSSPLQNPKPSWKLWQGI